MDAIFIDSKGNKKNFLYQYDVDQTFVIENFEYTKAPKVHFSIKSIKTALSVGSTLDKNKNLYVTIPDMLLTYGENIIAYLYVEGVSNSSTIETVFISVVPRKRQANYIYTEEFFVRSINGAIMAKDNGISEVALWADRNERNEDRKGYFVSVSYDAYNDNLIVTKATSINDVYGVVVDKTGIVSNCAESKLDNEGDLLQQYAYICTSGFAVVIDNNTCSVGSLCVPNNLGTAVPSSNSVGYKVVSRIDDRHILIFVDPSMKSMNDFQSSIDYVDNSLSLHSKNKENPHNVQKSQIGLSNVDNTSDLKKPVSEAQSKAINDAKQEILDKLITKADLVDGVVPLSQLPSQVKERRVVDNIAARDAIEDKFSNLQVYVIDATGDNTVSKGGADYLYDGTNWIKTGESESMDVVLSSHASTHAAGGSDAISPASIGAVSQADFDALKEQVEELAAFIEGIKNADVNQY